ncbi:efflux RND transporter periplasmic adaptor subunit [Paracoccus sp. p4-l81]|uniref:efflux RND transporter periplasmic adaptor subunit n=1 Tax=Paracoccus sp. p4-l81 TaxID=3342806 RepID=UPI0035B82B46
MTGKMIGGWLLLLALGLAQAQAQDAPAPAATVARVALAEVQDQVPVSGTLVALNEVLIYPQVQGFEVTELLAQPGDRVDAGQVLARLSADTLRVQQAQAEAEYQRAEAGVAQASNQIAAADASLKQAVAALDRARQLSRSGTASRAVLDQAEAAEANARANAASAGDGLAVARAALAQADAARQIAALNLTRTEITAPVAGIITARDAQIGAVAAAAGQPLFRLIGGGELELRAEVIETALQGLAAGDPAELRVAGVGAVAGRVRLVPASVDPVTRLGDMRVALDPVQGLRPGLFASGVVVIDKRPALTVPAAAVLERADGAVVQVVQDGVVHTRPVTPGLLWQDRREIREGLAERETVLARAGAFFNDGDAVQPVDAASGTAP